MRTLYLLCITLHLLAAATWLGGMLVFVLVLMPALRSESVRAVAPALVQEIGLRVRRVGWASLATLAATGSLQLLWRGVSFSDLWSPGPTGNWERLLLAKLLLFGVLVTLQAVHDFRIGPRAGRIARERPGSREAEQARRLAGWLGRTSFALTVGIIGLAVLLVRGLP
jgi:putative copper export protein